MTRRSGFLDLVGPLLVNDTDPRAPVYGLRVGEQHANSRGGVHGRVLTTLADVALGYGALAAHGEALALVTASLTIDYTGSAAVGDTPSVSGTRGLDERVLVALQERVLALRDERGQASGAASAVSSSLSPRRRLRGWAGA